MFQPQQAAELGSFSHMVLALESRIQDRVMGSPPVTKKSCWDQACVRVSLHGGPERLLCEAVVVKPGLPWRSQDVGDARAVGFMLRKVANREWNQPKRKKYVAVNKAERSWSSHECFDIRHGDAIWSFPSCFFILLSSRISSLAPFPPFWNGNVYSVPFYAGSM